MGKSHSDNENSDLADRIRSGDRSAETALVEKYGPRVAFFVSRKLRQSGKGIGAISSDDICQEAWIAVLENLRKGYLKDSDKLSAYIYKIFSNKVINAVNSAQDQATVPLTENQPGSASEDQEERVKSPQEKKFSRVWKKLTTKERRILYLRYIHLWPHNQIAELLGISEQSCRKALQRAKEHFRKEFAGLL
jgi:RNA polymerase sigma factor (sigma-70 family)